MRTRSKIIFLWPPYKIKADPHPTPIQMSPPHDDTVFSAIISMVITKTDVTSSGMTNFQLNALKNNSNAIIAPLSVGSGEALVSSCCPIDQPATPSIAHSQGTIVSSLIGMKDVTSISVAKSSDLPGVTTQKQRQQKIPSLSLLSRVTPNDRTAVRRRHCDVSSLFSRGPALLFLFFLLLTTATIVVHGAYIVSIPAKDEECYFIISPPGTGRGSTLYGNFDLLDDGVSSDPLSVVVLDSVEEHVLFRSRRRAKEGIFQINLQPNQKVNLCIQNGIFTAGRGRKTTTERRNDGLTRIVGFQFSIEPKNEAQELLSQNERIIQSTQDLTREITNLKNHHEFMRTREAKHREVVEQTFSQLMFWMILEGVTVVLIAAAQVSLKRVFCLVELEGCVLFKFLLGTH
jgi:hypothetical protein